MRAKNHCFAMRFIQLGTLRNHLVPDPKDSIVLKEFRASLLESFDKHCSRFFTEVSLPLKAALLNPKEAYEICTIIPKDVLQSAYFDLSTEALAILPEIDSTSAEDAIPLSSESQIRCDLDAYQDFVVAQGNRLAKDFDCLKWWCNIGSQ
jgi:hypothetical protein